MARIPASQVPWATSGRLSSGSLPWEEEEEEQAPTSPDDPRYGYPSMGEIGQAALEGASGFAESFQAPIYGAMDWAGIDAGDNKGLLSKTSRARALQMASDEADKSGWGTAGNVIGEGVQLAGPGGAGFKAGSKLLGAADKTTKLGKALAKHGGKLGLVGADSLAMGGREALMADEGERGEAFLEGAGTGALGAGVGLGVASAIKPLAKGFAKTRAAKELLDQGVEMTPGQMAKSQVVQGLESTMGVTPFLAQGTRNFRDVGVDTFNKAALRKAWGPKVKGVGKITEGGQKGIQQLKNLVDDGYANAWGKAENNIKRMGISPKKSLAFGNDLKMAQKDLGEKGASVLRRVQRDYDKLIGGDTKALKSIDNTLRNTIADAGDDYILRESLQDLRSSLRESVGEGAQDALKAMDSKYGKFLAARRASSMAKQDTGVFDPSTLTDASGSVGGESLTSRGLAPMQDFATLGRESVGRSEGGAPLEWFRRLAKTLPSPETGMKAVGKGLMGDTATQQAIAKLLKEQPWLTPSVAAAMISGEQ